MKYCEKLEKMAKTRDSQKTVEKFKDFFKKRQIKRKSRKKLKKNSNIVKFENMLANNATTMVVLKPLSITDEVFRKALFKLHGIRNFNIVVDRLPIEDMVPEKPKKFLLGKPKVHSVRDLVPWLPTAASLQSKSVQPVNDKGLCL